MLAWFGLLGTLFRPMSEQRSQTAPHDSRTELRAPNRARRFTRRRALSCTALLLGLALFVFSGRPSATPQPRATAAGEQAERVEPQAELAYAADGLPIKPADPDAPLPEGPMHPHPVTEAHERIYRENNLVAALNLAVDLEDAPRIRELVAQYRTEYPEDDHRLQDGYAIIADCLDRSDDTVRTRARRFWETEIRSQTRRYVRRHCLER